MSEFLNSIGAIVKQPVMEKAEEVEEKMRKVLDTLENEDLNPSMRESLSKRAGDLIIQEHEVLTLVRLFAYDPSEERIEALGKQVDRAYEDYQQGILVKAEG